MPNYDFENTETGEIETHFMSISEIDTFKENNPKLRKLVTAPAIVSGVSGSKSLRSDGGMQEVFSKISEKHPDSPLADRYGKKSTKEIKTREVLKKHGIRK